MSIYLTPNQLFWALIIISVSNALTALIVSIMTYRHNRKQMDILVNAESKGKVEAQAYKIRMLEKENAKLNKESHGLQDKLRVVHAALSNSETRGVRE